jgi:hypothetical protein
MLRSYPQVEVIEHPFIDVASQCNYGLQQVTSPWVLSLDADWEPSDELVRELMSLTPRDSISGYRARFIYRVYGRALRGSLYPPRIVLLRKDAYHDDRKPLARWFTSQQRYSPEEAEYLLNTPRNALRRNDKIRLMGWPAPIAVFFYTLFVKGCLFDGWAGWYYALQRATAEMMIALEVTDRRLRRSQAAEQGPSGGKQRVGR